MAILSSLFAVLGVLLSFVVPVGGGYLLWRFVRAFERRHAVPADLAAMEERVQQLEEANTRMEAELVQLTEAQRFTTALLVERSAASSK